MKQPKGKIDALFISAIIAIPIIIIVLMYATVVHIRDFYIMREASQSLPNHKELLEQLNNKD